MPPLTAAFFADEVYSGGEPLLSLPLRGKGDHFGEMVDEVFRVSVSK